MSLGKDFNDNNNLPKFKDLKIKEYDSTADMLLEEANKRIKEYDDKKKKELKIKRIIVLIVILLLILVAIIGE